MPITGDGFDPMSSDEITEDSETYFEQLYDNPALNDGDITQALIETQAKTLAQNQEQTMAELYDSGFVQTATGVELTRKAREIGVIRRPATQATGVVTFSRSDAASQDYTIPEGTRVSTPGEDSVEFATTETVTLASGTTSVDATVQAVDGGTEGNVAADTITVGTSTISGVESVTNPQPTGDPTYTDTNGNPLVQGTDREDDESLRERALESTNIGGAATVPAIEAGIKNIETVISANVIVDEANDTIEPIIYGGDNTEIGKTLMDVVGVTTETVGGNNGTQHSYTAYSDVLSDGSRTLYWSSPSVVDVDLAIDLVHTSTFVGKDSIRQQLAEYIGGIDVNGAQQNGVVGVSEDIYITEIEEVIEQDGNGVVGVTSISTTPSKTTNSNGLEVVPIATSEVPEVDATDGSITFNLTQR